MAAIKSPDSGLTFSIDVTEVTKGQYDNWLATNPALPPNTDPNCGWNMSFVEQGTGFTGTDAVHHPVVYVDWCDAYAYCLGVGKRLCGAIAGGSVDPSTTASAMSKYAQWECACTSGGVHKYPYGDTYEATFCDGSEFGASVPQTVVVGSLQNCVTPASGLGAYDMVGNVAEWVDNCSANDSIMNCATSGGSFASDARSLGYGCGLGGPHSRNDSFDYVGFRCCSK
jgi:formylglycine-generating enzyme required for sulfatase activity